MRVVPSYLLKLDRANVHLAAVEAAVNAWLTANACEVVGAPVGDTAEYVLRARIPFQPPPEVSLLIGECACPASGSRPPRLPARGRLHLVTASG